MNKMSTKMPKKDEKSSAKKMSYPIADKAPMKSAGKKMDVKMGKKPVKVGKK